MPAADADLEVIGVHGDEGHEREIVAVKGSLTTVRDAGREVDVHEELAVTDDLLEARDKGRK